MFKKLRGVNLPEEKQGLIYYICVNYADMPFVVQQKIDQLCLRVGGGDYYNALREVMLGKRTVREAAIMCPCSESTLKRMRRRFYEEFEKV